MRSFYVSGNSLKGKAWESNRGWLSARTWWITSTKPQAAALGSSQGVCFEVTPF